MLTETNLQYRNTSWCWLRSDQLAADLVVSPFDNSVWRLPGPVATLESYHASDDETAAVELLLEARVTSVVEALPHNRDIVGSDDDGAPDFDANDDLDELNATAVMPGGEAAAQPAAFTGADPKVGTDAVAPCIAMLGRVQRPQDQWTMGCSHLTAYNMATPDAAYRSVTNLVAAIVSPGLARGQIQLYAVGGRAGYADNYHEFSRLLAAAQQYAYDLGGGQYTVQLAGARLPANKQDHALAVYIDPHGVWFTSDESDPSGENSD